MKKDIIQAVKEKYNITSLKGYLDFPSNEFQGKPIGHIAETYSLMVMDGVNIHSLIKRYNKIHKGKENKYKRESVKPTLIKIISYIKTGIVYDSITTKSLEKLPIAQVIDSLNQTVSEKVKLK